MVLLTKTEAQRVFLILDSCQSGAVVEAVRDLAAPEPRLMDDAVAQKALRRIARVGGIHVLAASRAHEPATELQLERNGALTYLVLEGIHGRADGAVDGRNDNHVATSGHRATIPVPAHTPAACHPTPSAFHSPADVANKAHGRRAQDFVAERAGIFSVLATCIGSLEQAHGIGGEDLTDDEPVEAHPERRPVRLDGRGRQRAEKCIDAGGEQLGFDPVQDEFAPLEPPGRSTYLARQARRVSGFGMSGS